MSPFNADQVVVVKVTTYELITMRLKLATNNNGALTVATLTPLSEYRGHHF